MLWYFDLIFGMWVYKNKLQIKFTFRSGPMIFGRVMALGLWNLAKYLVVTTFVRYVWIYWFDFWYMHECIMMSYRSSLHFVPVQWFLAELSPWTLKFGQIFSCHHFLYAMLGHIDFIFGMQVYKHKLQINFEIRSGWMIFGQLTAVGLWNWVTYLVVITLFHSDLRYWLDFWYESL